MRVTSPRPDRRIAAVTIAVGALACRAPAQVAAPSPYPAVTAACSTERIGRVAITGAPRELVPALVVLEGTLDDAERTDRIVRGATESLRWQGYAKARIAVTREVGCFTDLRVIVELGPKYVIARIEFDADDEFPRAERIAAIEDALGTVNTVGGVHIDYRLRRALDGLERRYRKAGWLDAQIAPPVVTYEHGGRVRITIRVDAGRRYGADELRRRRRAQQRFEARR